jgi:uncharacterized membrane protein YsdA (DUF1294 family)
MFFELPLLHQIVIVYLACINIVTFFWFGLDKLQAQIQSRRTPEKVLWFLSLVGGSLGALAAMKFFRHKTKKGSFQTIFLLIFCVQVAVVFFVLSLR